MSPEYTSVGNYWLDQIAKDEAFEARINCPPAFNDDAMITYRLIRAPERKLKTCWTWDDQQELKNWSFEKEVTDALAAAIIEEIDREIHSRLINNACPSSSSTVKSLSP